MSSKSCEAVCYATTRNYSHGSLDCQEDQFERQEDQCEQRRGANRKDHYVIGAIVNDRPCRSSPSTDTSTYPSDNQYTNTYR